MAGPYDLVLKGGTLVTPSGIGLGDVGVRDGLIAGIGAIAAEEAGEVIDATGLHVLPGVIDSQVHFREPGLIHKEDLETGARAAVLGGVTAVFEMPNTLPLTITAEAFHDKIERATGRMACDFAFFMGGSAQNAEDLVELERLPGCSGVKIFMGSSTGNLLVAEDEDIARVLKAGRRRVAVHSEDEHRLASRVKERIEGDPSSHPVWRDVEAAMSSSRRIVRLAREANRPVHVLHVSSAEEMDFFETAKDIVTVEVTPQHLTLKAPDCYEELGTFAQMNPPIRDGRAQARLWQAVSEGLADILGSDHAPHTKAEKEEPYPRSPSGMPGVQTLVPIMLDHVNAGRLSLERFVDMSAHGPQRVFGIKNKGRLVQGYDADFTLVDLKREQAVEGSWLASKAGWSPYEGRTLKGWPVATIIRGRTVMSDGEIVGPAQGRPVKFIDTFPDA